MDTARDFRILIAEDALERIEDIIRHHKLNMSINWGSAQNIVEKLRSCLMRVKYSYLPLRLLLKMEELRSIQNYSIELSRTILNKNLIQKFNPDPYMVAITRYSLRTLYGLRYRLSLGEDNKPYYAVDIEGVEIVSVHKHPRADRLYITRAEGIFPYTIITNIERVRKGEVRAAAILPPAIIRGELSEAMYCSDPIPAEYKGKRPPDNLVRVSEVNNIVYGIVSKLSK